jgi:hypothetical protein
MWTDWLGPDGEQFIILETIHGFVVALEPYARRATPIAHKCSFLNLFQSLFD